MPQPVKTTCAYCGVGCGVIATPMTDGSVAISGDKDHPANYGRLCSKGSALGETLGLEGRLLSPQVDGKAATWDTALTRVAKGFTDTIREHGPDSVAFYVSGQMLTEDYYVANKLMKGFIGSANIDSNSRLCMSSAVAGHKRAFGEDIVPGCYDDLEEADLTILVGANSAWCHPVLYQRIMAAKETDQNKRMVVIDPRVTSTSESADLHLAIKPGTDGYLFNGLLFHLAMTGRLNNEYLEHHVSGMKEAISAAMESTSSLGDIANICGVSISDLKTFYDWFATTEKTVTLYSQGINQSTSGTDKVSAILNVHLATGRIGKTGMGPFSLTGQPNAMGGREAGGLSNTLTAHMEIENERHRDIVSKFWGTSNLPVSAGLRAVDIFRAVKEGRVKALWIMATNPAVTMPEADLVQEALKQCDLVVVSDCMADTQTTRLATVLLPALTWGEKDGTVTNSERCISRQRPFLPAPGKARPDWWIISEIAKRMGFGQAFPYQNTSEIFSEYAELTAYNNNGERLLNLADLMSMDKRAYDKLNPTQWPLTGDPSKRLFTNGVFQRLNGKARMHPVTPVMPEAQTSADYPYVMNTGRIRDQWHTMTRSGKSPRLSSHSIEPYVEIHPEDAQALSLKDGTLATIASPLGKLIARVVYANGQQQGNIFVPMHWSDPVALCARVGALIEARTDRYSGQPEFKQTAVSIGAYKANWQAFILSSRPTETELSTYRVSVTGDGFQWYECAGDDVVEDWDQHARKLLGITGHDEWVAYHDQSKGSYRYALLSDGKLIACLFMAADHNLVPRHWLAGLMNKTLSKADRSGLLSGQPPLSQDVGPTICACFGVGTAKIIEAIKSKSLTSVQEIGAMLKAGTNCGSCKPELGKLLQKTNQMAGA